jgi:streptomycin 6-kinase
MRDRRDCACRGRNPSPEPTTKLILDGTAGVALVTNFAGVLSKGSVPLEMPEKVRRKAAAMGETGRVWLAHLPRQIAELERRWAIKVGQPMRHGTEAFVAEARTGDGLDVVVKIVIPGIDPMRQELRVLRAAHGVGYAKLIRGDEIEHAMLLEKLGPQLHEFHFPEDRRIQIICATLCKA